MSVTRGQILRYTLLPGLLPRVHEFFTTGFGYVPYLIAVIYQAAGLIPQNHPYLNPANIGRFGVRHVLAEASRRLVFDRNHADQVAIFFIILTGAVLIFIQFLLFALALVAGRHALAFSPNDIFSITAPGQFNPNPTPPSQDLAFIMLDLVFGVKDIFNSCISMVTPCLDLKGTPILGGPMSGTMPFPTPFHIALHNLLHFYSLGIFFIAVFVVIYYVIVIAAETAASGTPFGQRLNKTWAPVRLIMCFALLVPLNITGDRTANAGLNGAQIITLWSARFGSTFATNAWVAFNQNIAQQTALGDPNNLVAVPTPPSIASLGRFIFLAKVCQYGETALFKGPPSAPDRIIAPYIIREQEPNPIVPGANYKLTTGTSYTAARAFSNNGNITIRFGEQQDSYKSYKGTVENSCGDIIIPVNSIDGTSGANAIAALYYQMVLDMWNSSAFALFSTCLWQRNTTKNPDPACAPVPNVASLNGIIDGYQQNLEAAIPAAVQQQINNGTWNIPARLAEKGWAGAAIWYNRVAEVNGTLVSTLQGVPEAFDYPSIMQFVSATNTAHHRDEGYDAKSIFDPSFIAKSPKIKFPRGPDDYELARILDQAEELWQDPATLSASNVQTGDGPIVDTINFIMGTNGIFSMRRNTDTHPLAQLSAIGRGMMEAAIRNFIVGNGVKLVGSAFSGIIPFLGHSLDALGNLPVMLAGATIAIAFLLYYVLPFMPFIYFFFATAGWVKAIFEAIVAMPLWALAHIRIDGHGLGGPGATQGYFLILEIFLRPILILFGLVASIQIFAALVKVMNEIFSLVVQNATGFDRATEAAGTGVSQITNAVGPIDTFFFTAIYAIMCYMIGLGCFKLIDNIPNNILRWMGLSIKPMNAQEGDTGGELLERGYQAATLATQKVQGGALATLIGR